MVSLTYLGEKYIIYELPVSQHVMLKAKCSQMQQKATHEGMKGEGVKDLKPYSLGTKRELGYKCMPMHTEARYQRRR